MGGVLIGYLDTHAALFLLEPRLAKFSPASRRWLRTAELRISPIVLVEIALLFEIGRIRLSAPAAFSKLNVELGVAVCDHPFPIVAETAAAESWTRDPFDRVIVAHARCNGQAPLLTLDRAIHAHYPQARR